MSFALIWLPLLGCAPDHVWDCLTHLKERKRRAAQLGTAIVCVFALNVAASTATAYKNDDASEYTPCRTQARLPSQALKISLTQTKRCREFSCACLPSRASSNGSVIGFLVHESCSFFVGFILGMSSRIANRACHVVLLQHASRKHRHQLSRRAIN
jgi:hypothetical protein